MKIPAALGAAALALGLLTACGGSSDDQYCKDLKAAQTQFDSISSSDVSKLDAAFKTFHKLAQEAPDDIKSDWKTLDDAITTVTKALDDAGIKFSDFAKIQQNKVPEGVDPTKLQEVATKFASLGNAKFTKASEAVQKHAKDVCKVTLG